MLDANYALRRHAAAVRRASCGAVPVLRGAAHAGHVQPVRHAAVPAPRAAAVGAALPAVPVSRTAVRRPAAARRLQPLPAAVDCSITIHIDWRRHLLMVDAMNYNKT